MDLDMKKSEKNMGRVWSISQIVLRLITLFTSAISAMIVFKNHQTINIMGGLSFSTKYSDDPNIKMFAAANAIVACFSVFALIFSLIVVSKKSVNSSVFFYFFLHDLIMVTGLALSCGAATAVGFEGKHGNSKAGWAAICDMFGKYCKRATMSVTISYLCLITYFFLSILSAQKSGHA
ncbi:CASP-like protein 1F1 [Impatiens glandulifera]|uniref:CASP-like protein 1F1 n=1 Tax=Impatiens glandulifera TaxID=253017 RepID=UPI001FB0A27C|nr:CASP-like protein 1F1 [Impatiens glandulifera]